MRSESRPVRLAIAGFGLAGQRHANAIRHVENVSLSAIADPDPESRRLAAGHGLTTFEEFEDMLEADIADGVVLSTPTRLHATQGRTCIEARCPVLIEKPLATDVGSARELVEAAEHAQVPLLVGHHRRFNPLISKAREMIAGGGIGEIRAAHATCWFYKPDRYFDVSPWRKLRGAGPVSVNLVHDIDLIRHLCGGWNPSRNS